jgi:hypothetical protein
MTFTPKDWKDRPFGPDAGESLDAYEARLAAYATANPSQVTPIDGAALEDLETRVAGYTDTHSAATTGVHGIANTSAPALTTDSRFPSSGPSDRTDRQLARERQICSPARIMRKATLFTDARATASGVACSSHRRAVSINIGSGWTR